MCIIGSSFYAFVKTDIPNEVNSSSADNDRHTFHTQIVDLEHGDIHLDDIHQSHQVHEASIFDSMSDSNKHITGIVLSILSGLWYGTNATPPQWLKDHGYGDNEAEYIFPHFVGIFITSTFYFWIYCWYCKSKPSLYNEAVLPGVLSGVLWAIAQSAFIIANMDLSFVVSFPIVSTGPGLIASLFGVFLFKEITEIRSLIILLCGFLISVGGIVMISLST